VEDGRVEPLVLLDPLYGDRPATGRAEVHGLVAAVTDDVLRGDGLLDVLGPAPTARHEIECMPSYASPRIVPNTSCP
jgi:hypothetical protein